MGVRFTPAPNLKVTVESLPGVGEDLEHRAENIRSATQISSAMASRHRGRYGAIVITKVRDGARRVAALGPLAHLDEWGSANNSPKASMRRAAEREGRFQPDR